MQVGFNPNISFKSSAKPMEENDSEPKFSAKDVRRTYRESVGDVTKFAAKTGEMTKASLKAIMYGAAAEAGMLAANWIFKSLPNAARGKSKMTFWQSIRHPLRSISKAGKWWSAGVAVCVAGYHVTRGILKSNQKTANIDHQLKIGHRDK